MTAQSEQENAAAAALDGTLARHDTGRANQTEQNHTTTTTHTGVNPLAQGVGEATTPAT